jgi:hypothetical protein
LLVHPPLCLVRIGGQRRRIENPRLGRRALRLRREEDERGPAFETKGGFLGRTLATYPKEQSPLASGYLLHPDRIQGKAAALEVSYGKGRVFYSILGHDAEAWDNPVLRQMYFQAIRWALRLVDGDATPQPRVR